jgi:anti-anti-sigma regulatory factor
MDFKIDTKDTFTVIIPQSGVFNAKLADEIASKCEEARQNGSKNYIIDLQHINEAEDDAAAGLITLHEQCYSSDESLVFTGMTPEVMSVLKNEEADLLLNLAPKMIEAVDIVSMEILERELFGEE